MADPIEGCGCCGRIIKNAEWCGDCVQHLKPHPAGGHLAPWNRTYYAQFNKPCPNEEP